MVAMSGGVDSSAAAFLMKEKGYDVTGVTMKLYVPPVDGLQSSCCSVTDMEDAKSVCAKLEIPYEVADYRDDFENSVIKHFADEYEAGRTPNPCIECNRRLKFGSLMQRALSSGYDRVATGHYARIAYDEITCRYRLLKGIDPSKDQSYVLYMLGQDELSHLEFPCGEYTKDRIRDIAAEHGFVNASKKDSQDICFIPDGDYARFLSERRGGEYEPGDFVDSEGNVLGRHKGIINYTVGQRRGLGISSAEPYYVVDIRPDINEVVLGRKKELEKKEVMATDFNWLSIDEPLNGHAVECSAKIRYSHKGAFGRAKAMGDGRVKMVFDEPVGGVSPGQALVLYDGDMVLGGGIIAG